MKYSIKDLEILRAEFVTTTGDKSVHGFIDFLKEKEFFKCECGKYNEVIPNPSREIYCECGKVSNYL